MCSLCELTMHPDCERKFHAIEQELSVYKERFKEEVQWRTVLGTYILNTFGFDIKQQLQEIQQRTYEENSSDELESIFPLAVCEIEESSRQNNELKFCDHHVVLGDVGEIDTRLEDNTDIVFSDVVLNETKDPEFDDSDDDSSGLLSLSSNSMLQLTSCSSKASEITINNVSRPRMKFKRCLKTLKFRKRQPVNPTTLERVRPPSKKWQTLMQKNTRSIKNVGEGVNEATICESELQPKLPVSLMTDTTGIGNMMLTPILPKKRIWKRKRTKPLEIRPIPCKPNCQNKCVEWNPEDRQAVFELFRNLGDRKKEREFILANVKQCSVKRKRSKMSQFRTMTIKYFLPQLHSRQSSRQVCKAFFNSSLGLPNGYVDYTVNSFYLENGDDSCISGIETNTN